jgi:DNA-binding protein HU-beta
MYRDELVQKVAEATGLAKKDVDKTIVAAIGAVREELLAGGKLTIVGFGTLEANERAARQGINPQTKKIVSYPAIKSVRFKVGKDLKAELNGTKKAKK